MLDEPVLVRVAHGLGAVVDAELAVDVRQVELDRLFRQEQLLRDLLVREPRLERLQDGQLALTQLGGVAVPVAVLEQAERLEDRALDRLPYRSREISRIDVLDDERARAAAQRRLDDRRIVDGREHRDPHLWITLAQPLQDGEPVYARHPNVEQDDVRARLADKR
jgi:hypothetical protein